jgi:DNA-binding NtrC family response regulator
VSETREDTWTSTAVVPVEDGRTVRAFQLTVLSGPNEGTTYQSTTERVVIGSHQTADFVLDDRTVSRFHCEIVVDEDGAVLRDLDSRNGTRIDCVAIRSVVLEGPVILKIGRSDIRFELVGDTISIPLAPEESFNRLVGSSQPMRQVLAMLGRAAGTRANILIEGEPGTGKGLAASAIHEESERANGPFGVVDCSLPEAALRRELFGTEDPDEAGALELCDGGTLVLENLGALTGELQAELMRALDQGAARRNGAGPKRSFDVRIIGTTRRNLRRDVNAGRLKTGLYNLIAVIRVRLPPLRERPQDIPLLVSAFVRELDASDATAAELLSGSAIESLRDHSWPDNVRELRTYVERCVATEEVGQPGEQAPEAAPVVDLSQPLKQAREEWVRYFERRYLAELLEDTGQNVSAAARKAKIDRVHLHRLLSRAGLR